MPGSRVQEGAQHGTTSIGGYVLDKVEGLAFAEDGTMWDSADNDGVDDHSGKAMFFSVKAERRGLGPY